MKKELKLTPKKELQRRFQMNTHFDFDVVLHHTRHIFIQDQYHEKQIAMKKV